ncbi:MAG: hypothetical protein IPN53_03015 [Comamonadaceae bacterium]|nr:hypothetical protein [Comamonadaceae bacterium]
MALISALLALKVVRDPHFSCAFAEFPIRDHALASFKCFCSMQQLPLLISHHLIGKDWRVKLAQLAHKFGDSG